MGLYGLLVGAATTAVFTTAQWRSVVSMRDGATQSFERASAQTVKLASLRAQLDRDQVSTTGQRADALSETAETFGAAGLSERPMVSLEEQSDAFIPDSRLRQQTLQQRLASVSPATLGVFLVGLYQHRPHWIVTSLELTRPGQRQGNAFDVAILMVRTYQPGKGTRDDARSVSTNLGRGLCLFSRPDGGLPSSVS